MTDHPTDRRLLVVCAADIIPAPPPTDALWLAPLGKQHSRLAAWLRGQEVGP